MNVNSIDGTYTPYLSTIAAPAGADESAAAAQAAHDALVGPAKSCGLRRNLFIP